MNAIDNKGSTALHWASFLGCENSAYYLASWGLDMNVQDKDGSFTPLHLAVISGNVRIVRRLLLKGASRTLKDKKGKTPIDLAREQQSTNLINLLRENIWWENVCNIRAATNPQRNKGKYFYTFMILLLIGLTTSFLTVIPCNTRAVRIGMTSFCY